MGNYWLKSVLGQADIPINKCDPALSDFSVAFWFNSTTVDTRLLQWSFPNVYINASLYPDGTIHFDVDISVPSSTTALTTATSYADGSNHLIVLTCDRNSTTGLKLYVDGVLKDTDTAIPFMSMALIQIISSYTSYGDSGYLTLGYLDQIRFYKGVILSQAQITAIYNLGVGVKVTESDFATICGSNIGWYSEFDDNDSPTEFIGRYWNGTAWAYSLGTFTGTVTKVLGGVPFTDYDNIEEALYWSITTAGNEVMTILSTAKVYLHEVPQGVDLPAIVYMQLATEFNQTSQETIELRRKTYQFDCWASTMAGAIALADALKVVLNATKGIYDNIKIERCNPIDEGDAQSETINDELKRKGRRVDYEVIYQDIS
jgi:hypothetical protein